MSGSDDESIGIWQTTLTEALMEAIMPQATTSRLHLSEIAPHLVQSEIRSMTVECDAVAA